MLTFVIGLVLLSSLRIIMYVYCITLCPFILRTYEPCFLDVQATPDFRNICVPGSGCITYITPLVSLPLIFVQKYIVQLTSLSLILTFTNPHFFYRQFISFRDLR
jgi:hypothetical protein